MGEKGTFSKERLNCSLILEMAIKPSLLKVSCLHRKGKQAWLKRFAQHTDIFILFKSQDARI